MKINEKLILPIIRNKFPSMIKSELVKEYPLPPIEYNDPFERLEIVGGWIWDSIKGLIFIPYRLIRNEIQMPKDQNEVLFYLVLTKELEELERAETEKDFEQVRDRWKEMVANFIITKIEKET